MSNKSISSAPAPDTTTKSFLEYKPKKLFQTELFNNYVSSLVRKHIVQQYVDADHPVLVDEQKLINSATSELRSHLGCSVFEWKTSWKMAKLTVIHHIRHLAEERLTMHDVDEETRETALESIYREDYEDLFSGIVTDNYSS